MRQFLFCTSVFIAVLLISACGKTEFSPSGSTDTSSKVASAGSIDPVVSPVVSTPGDTTVAPVNPTTPVTTPAPTAPTAPAVVPVTTVTTNPQVVSDPSYSCGETGKKVLVCHTPAGHPGAKHTLCVGAPAVVAHAQHICNHGGNGDSDDEDHLGLCPGENVHQAIEDDGLLDKDID